MTAEIMTAAEANMNKALDNLKEAFVGVRTGRANPMMLDKIKVDYYGVPTPINQMAAVKTPDATGRCPGAGLKAAGTADSAVLI